MERGARQPKGDPVVPLSRLGVLALCSGAQCSVPGAGVLVWTGVRRAEEL